MKKPLYKVVDLFSGAGGLSLGFECPNILNGLGQLGYRDIGYPSRTFETILAVEKNQQASETFSLNFDAEVYNTKIESIKSFTQWTDADVVIGGPPCQGFSNLNSTKTENLDDARNRLWKEFMRAVSDISPDVFLIENVPRFLSSQECVNLVNHAEEMGYTTVVDDLWANDYGVPQKRRRGFVLGSKLGIPFFPSPPQEPTRTVRDAISDLPAQPTGKDLHVGRDVTERSQKRMEAVPPGGNRFDIPKEILPDCWKGYEEGGTDLYGRLWWDEPSVTIRTEFVKPEKGRYLHPERNRSITMREGARLQTISDDFSFSTPYKNHITNQVGNAVPPKLAYHIGVAIKAHLEGKNSNIIPEESSEFEHISQSSRKRWKVLKKYTSEPQNTVSKAEA